MNSLSKKLTPGSARAEAINAFCDGAIVAPIVSGKPVLSLKSLATQPPTLSQLVSWFDSHVDFGVVTGAGTGRFA